MAISSLNDNIILELLEEAYKKISLKAEQDTKVLYDMNNALNWILTLTTVFFVFYNSHQEKMNIYLQIIYKLLFTISIVILAIHKLILIKYERSKGGYLASLKTHQIDLKFSISNIHQNLKNIVPCTTVEFINAFRDGEFFYVCKDISMKELKKLDQKINIYGSWIKRTFNIGVVIFFLNIFLITYLLFLN